MAEKQEATNVELICAIVHDGVASRLIKSARSKGIPGATVALGRGTVNNRLLCFLGLSDVKKEVVFMVADQCTAYAALEEISREFEFAKPNHGIAFTTSVGWVVGTQMVQCERTEEEKEVDRVMYDAITVIVEKGRAEDVIDAATKAGSKGGTILNGRGSGIHETSKLFSMNIEPEKEIVMILSETQATDQIVSSIRECIKIDEPGNGIIYVQKVNRTYGIYQ